MTPEHEACFWTRREQKERPFRYRNNLPPPNSLAAQIALIRLIRVWRIR